MNFSYGEEKLTLKKVFEIAQGKRKGILIPEVVEGIQKSNAIVQQVIRSGKTVYGINTGFGPLCDTLISENETQTLQKNLNTVFNLMIRFLMDKYYITFDFDD